MANLPQYRALQFALHFHRDQQRQYLKHPYIMHPLEVGEILEGFHASAEMVAAAYLHDVVKDCGVPMDRIESMFGSEIAGYVSGFITISVKADGNFQARSEIDRQYMAHQSAEVKTMKLADILSDLRSFQYNLQDKDCASFYRLYREEIKLLLEVLQEGDKPLMLAVMDKLKEVDATLARI